MDMERVWNVFYVCTCIVSLFSVIVLGKFFCVRILYDIYDKLDDMVDNEAGFIYGGSLLVCILLRVAIWTENEAFIMGVGGAAVLGMLFISLFTIGFVLSETAEELSEWHKNIKKRKKM